MNILNESETLEAADKILYQAQINALNNDAAWQKLNRVRNLLQKQFKAEFEAIYKQDPILEAAEIA